jgi:hypothetical protein
LELITRRWMNGKRLDLRLELINSLYTTPAVLVHGIFGRKKLDIKKIRRRPLKHKTAVLHLPFMYLPIGSSPSPLQQLRRSSV